jgi:hypothetical protein
MNSKTGSPDILRISRAVMTSSGDQDFQHRNADVSKRGRSRDERFALGAAMLGQILPRPRVISKSSTAPSDRSSYARNPRIHSKQIRQIAEHAAVSFTNPI